MTQISKCKEFCDRLSDYLDGEIGENECRLIEDHIRKCFPCAVTLSSLKTTIEVCSRGLSEEMPKDVSSRLKQFLREHCAQFHS
jgi:hypothetical protein